jgi:GNAT superfamily N-acetyltransferase
MTSPWNSFGELALGFYGTGASAQAVRGDGWYAALSRTSSAELNVCCVLPGAEDVRGLIALLGASQAALVFTPEPAHAARGAMTAAGFEVTAVAEPLMRCVTPPPTYDSRFRVRQVASEAELLSAIGLTSAAHQVDASLLDATIGAAARSGEAQVWLAEEDGAPASTVWLRRSGASLGVMEMMTPPQHQRRGAGRALLTTALAASWTDDVHDALLLATPAGRRLYERVGFTAVDESLTCYRGLDDGVLDAIGQEH